jgi:hypothetical protein
MSGFSPEGRALLRGARNDLDASPEDRDRLGRALAARLGIAGTLAGASATAAAATISTPAAAGVAAGASRAGLLVASKWIAGALLVAATGVGGDSIYRMASSGAGTRGAAPALLSSRQGCPPGVCPAGSSPSAGAVPSATSTPGGSALAAPPEPPVPPRKGGAGRLPDAAPTPTREATGAMSREHASAPAAATKGIGGTVGAETRLLRSADEALRGGNPAVALTLLDEYARTFPHGVFSEERSAERVMTLCALGRTDEARAEARRFLATAQDSPLANDIRHSCGGADDGGHSTNIP